MGDDTMNEDFPEQEQRSAVCYRQWREAKTADNPMPPGFEYALPYFQDEDKITGPGNVLKAISRTDDEMRVGNYIVLFDGRDLEGIKIGTTEVVWTNPDGTRGEYFTKNTILDSPYTATGRVMVDMEHGRARERYGKDAPGRDDVLGYVDWSTKKITERGVWVERALDMHNWYMQWIGDLIDAGVIGTSSEAVEGSVEKAADGAILRWPLRRDTLTITPMEWRNKGEKVVRALKALGLPVPDDTGDQTEADPPPEQETAPEADPSAVAVAKARARLQYLKLSLEESQ